MKVYDKNIIEKSIIKWYQRLWIWILPTKIQVSSDGILRYKKFRGVTYIIGYGYF